MDAGKLRVRLRTALESRRPVPPDVSEWLLAGLARQESECCSLDEALGFKVGPGEAWRHPVRQRRRARLEAALLSIADLSGGRGSRQAGLIADALRGSRFGLPGIALDYLFRLQRRHGAELPTSRSAILQILQGRTRAQRDGVVSGKTAN